jgi:predicted nucleotidyltransferase
VETAAPTVIELTPRDDSERVLWAAALDLAELLAGLPWTLVGAQMVILHAFEAGQLPGRTTGDLDLLFDVRAHVGATGAATNRLLDAGFVETGRSMDDVAHRFIKGDVVVDVLAPEGLGERTSRETIDGAHTIQVPGGSQALERTEVVDVRLGDRVGHLPRPSLVGAILLKARAVGAAPDEAAKHLGDLAFLLGLIVDPRSLADGLRKSERKWLRSRKELADRANPAWRMTRLPDDAFVALGILVSEPGP